jgi:hypothetical protein
VAYKNWSSGSNVYSRENRLARVAAIANFGKMNKPQTTIANVNQAMLADMIGTTRPLVISL